MNRRVNLNIHERYIQKRTLVWNEITRDVDCTPRRAEISQSYSRTATMSSKQANARYSFMMAMLISIASIDEKFNPKSVRRQDQCCGLGEIVPDERMAWCYIRIRSGVVEWAWSGNRDRVEGKGFSKAVFLRDFLPLIFTIDQHLPDEESWQTIMIMQCDEFHQILWLTLCSVQRPGTRCDKDDRVVF